MKAVSTLTLIVCLVGSIALAGDYVRMNTDAIPSGAVAYKLEFFIERTCPIPVRITGISHGFTLTATGTAEFQFAGFEASPETDEWFSWRGKSRNLLFTNGLPLTWGTEGQFLTGGSTMPPLGGVPVLETEHKLFDLFLDVRGEGEILIDSAFVFAGGAWKWAGLTCGLGSNPDSPLFLAKDSSDLNHPIHITVFELPCGDSNADGSVDIDDAVFIINYIFISGPTPNPFLKADCDCSRGDIPVDIDDVVYLINYIFSSGNAPCDIDGDGEPDC